MVVDFFYFFFWLIVLASPIILYHGLEEYFDYFNHGKNACEARQQIVNKSSDSFADAIFWSDLGNH